MTRIDKYSILFSLDYASGTGGLVHVLISMAS